MYNWDALQANHSYKLSIQFQSEILFCRVSIAVTSCRGVHDYIQSVRRNVAHEQFVWLGCARPLSRLTQSCTRQIGIDGEHRSFRIIPALSVIKHESTGDFTPDSVGSVVLFVSVPTARLLHILHLSPAALFFYPAAFRPGVPPKKYHR